MKINIVDVGAMGGLQSYWQNVPHVAYLFEPNVEEYKKLKKNLPFNHRLYNLALSDKEQDLTINICRDPGLSSVYDYDINLIEKYSAKLEKWDIVKQTLISSKPLDYFNIDADFIKIDVEGYALSVLMGADKILNYTIGLEVEVDFMPFKINQPLFPKVQEYLFNKGFVLQNIKQVIRDRIDKNNFSENGYTKSKGGQIIYGIAFYLRPPEDPVVQIKKEQSKIIYKTFNKQGYLRVLNEGRS